MPVDDDEGIKFGGRVPRALLLNLESLFLPKTDALVDPELTRQSRVSLNTPPSAKNFPITVN
ncbi:hypothetical protein VCV18_001190 [Metarhizium anisopliae]